MTRQDDQYKLRMPEGMRARIAERARGNLRSMNSEIVMILASALGDRGETVAEEGPRKAASATVPNTTALPGGASTHA